MMRKKAKKITTLLKISQLIQEDEEDQEDYSPLSLKYYNWYLRRKRTKKINALPKILQVIHEEKEDQENKFRGYYQYTPLTFIRSPSHLAHLFTVLEIIISSSRLHTIHCKPEHVHHRITHKTIYQSYLTSTEHYKVSLGSCLQDQIFSNLALQDWYLYTTRYAIF